VIAARIAFDPALSVVVSQAFTIGARTFNDGEAFAWREAGIDEAQLLAFWRSGIVSFTAELANDAKPLATKPASAPQRRR
jgi:hypothetical protein